MKVIINYFHEFGFFITYWSWLVLAVILILSHLSTCISSWFIFIFIYLLIHFFCISCKKNLSLIWSCFHHISGVSLIILFQVFICVIMIVKRSHLSIFTNSSHVEAKLFECNTKLVRMCSFESYSICKQ